MVCETQFRTGMVLSTARQMAFSIAASVAATMIVSAWEGGPKTAVPQIAPALTSGGKFAARLDSDASPDMKDVDAPVSLAVSPPLSFLATLPLFQATEVLQEDVRAAPPSVSQRQSGGPRVAAMHHRPSASRLQTPPKRSDFIAAVAAAEQPSTPAIETTSGVWWIPTAAFRRTRDLVGSVWDRVIPTSF